LRARPAAREMEVVVLPVPPFCEAIEMTIDRQSTSQPGKWVWRSIPCGDSASRI
jgi:hypothetical protein